ncbi:putative lipoprotein [Burkholderia pseudomallei MSHR346]|uniref:Putative liporotein n=2 Tax=pseudomallei group TaxID=111527 RepID=A2S1Y8_BURM9|nr:putative liporotein [Burkholderia mallei NCTC 10229]EDK55590.1 lipoprotein, putative [Burkholderia mallei FMH]EEP49763.1 putative lipoprotein [Burkholderia pseudomallei MSHR346]
MRLSANQASACTIGASCRAKTGTVERWDIERGSPCIGKPRDIRREIGGRRCNP